MKPTPAPRFCSIETGVRALARIDVIAGQPLSTRYCKMCNAGDEELADIYVAEYRSMLSRTFRRVGTIVLFAS